MAQFKDYPVIGKILPKADGTRLRAVPSTFSTVYNSYPKGTLVTIDQVREYLETNSNEYVKAGDKWGRVIAVNGNPPVKTNGASIEGECWMAITYLGGAICTPDYSVTQDGGSVPPATAKIIGATLIPHYDNNTSGEPIKMVVES